MNKFSHPPIIILLDLLFVFLFILIQKTDRLINIEIPPNNLFTGGELFLYDKNKEDYFNLKNSEPNYSSGLMIKCGKQEECISAMKTYNKEIYIFIPTYLFEKMSEISFFALKSKAAKCAGLTFHISEKGKLDIDKIFTSNPCLKKIKGLKERYQE